MTTKICTKCKVCKSVTEFSLRRGQPRAQCKKCIAEYLRDYRKQHPHIKSGKVSPFRKRLYKYKMSLEEWEQRLNSQNGVCAICRRSPKEDGRSLCVDHDHACCPQTPTCGKCTRGLLCIKCNSSLGQLGDSIDAIQAVLVYLQRK